jgi:hypothetical protein
MFAICQGVPQHDIGCSTHVHAMHAFPYACKLHVKLTDGAHSPPAQEAILQERAYAWGYSASTPFKSDSAAGAPDQDQRPKALEKHSAMVSTSSARSSLDKAYATSSAVRSALPAGVAQPAHATDVPAESTDVLPPKPAPVLSSRGATQSSHHSPDMSRHSSGNGSSASPGAASVAAQQHGTNLRGSGCGRVGKAGDGSTDTTPAVLKARSDASVLKDLRLGTLLGQGCFGRVYRGEAVQACHCPAHGVSSLKCAGNAD